MSASVQSLSNYRQDAFTLVEVLVAVAIFGLLGVTLTMFLTSFLNIKFSTEMRARMRSDGDNALDRLEFYIRNGKTLPDVCDASSFPHTQDFYINTNTKLDGASNEYNRFHVAAVLTNSSDPASPRELRFYQFGPAYDNCVAPDYYSVSDNYTALTSTIQGSTGIIPFDVSHLRFTCDNDSFSGGKVVQIEMTIKYEGDSLSGNGFHLEEKFYRETAIRNTAAYKCSP